MSTDEERQERIENEIIVDANGEEDMKMGWYYYMQDELSFPFTASTMIKKRSGDYVKQKVDILNMAETKHDYFGNDIMLDAAYSDHVFNVGMTELTNIDAGEATMEAILDWKYWKRKYPHF